jgi:hypothetical protein
MRGRPLIKDAETKEVEKDYDVERSDMLPDRLRQSDCHLLEAISVAPWFILKLSVILFLALMFSPVTLIICLLWEARNSTQRRS